MSLNKITGEKVQDGQLVCMALCQKEWELHKCPASVSLQVKNKFWGSQLANVIPKLYH